MSILTFLKSLISPSRHSALGRCQPASRLCLEPLEDRAVPSSVVVFNEADGDRITFKSSLGDLSGKLFYTGELGRTYDVFIIDLRDARFNGTNFSVSVAKAKTGDGKAVVGYINAGTNNLGVVKVAGDLGDIDAGGGNAMMPAIKSLTVDSFGRFGQLATGDGDARVLGDVRSLVVKHDFISTNLYVEGNLGSVKIGGSLIGGADYGQIYATQNLGKVTIKGDIRGGSGVYTGSVGAGHDVESVFVGGSIYGGSGENSGNVFAAFTQFGKIGRVRVNGSVVGGQGKYSGAIGGYDSNLTTSPVSLGTVWIGKDIIGGGGYRSGWVNSRNGTLDRLTVKGSLIGGPGENSGLIEAYFNMGRVAILGSIYGGSGNGAGRIYGYTGIEFLHIRGDVRGSSGDHSGNVFFDGAGITSLRIGGAIIPGTGNYSGYVSD